MYWQNYLNGSIFPFGRALRISDVTSETVNFIDQDGNEFILYWKSPSSKHFEDEFSKYFTFENPEEDLKKIKEEDFKKIAIGHVERGMEKKLVLISWGYPPEMNDPLEKNIWKYWTTKDYGCTLYFDEKNDVLVHIEKP